MSLPSIKQHNECKAFLFKILVLRYFKEFLYFVLYFSMPLDNNLWYARVGIFEQNKLLQMFDIVTMLIFS